jgi:DNA repair exonuclease SbcCD ATPase subunit
MRSTLKRPTRRVVSRAPRVSVEKSKTEDKECRRHSGAVIQYSQDECPLCVRERSKEENGSKLEKDLSAANLQITKLQSLLEQQNPKLDEELENYKKLVEKYQEERSKLEATLQELEGQARPASPKSMTNVKSYSMREKDE